nr:unnamed protein product [Callosobruchus analis]
MPCPRYPQIKMIWAKTTKVSSIAGSMTRDRYFQIRCNLKVVIDADVPENERKVDKLFKIRPLIERRRLKMAPEVEILYDSSQVKSTSFEETEQEAFGSSIAGVSSSYN